MDENQQPNYIFLDTEADRQNLIDDIAKIHNAIEAHVKTIPEQDWYTPRYHGWSLGAMLGHLNLIDNLALLQIQIALIGFAPPVSMNTVNGFNDFMARVFQRRLVETSLRGMRNNETRIADFIMRLPMDKLSSQVYSPSLAKQQTIERYIQDNFLFHWQYHLQTMREQEGVQPPERPDTV